MSATYLSDTSDFRFLEARPGITMVLLANSPFYTILAVSNDFVTTSGRSREEVIGRSHFEIFPENPTDPASTGIHSLRHSFDYIVKNRTSHSLPLVRYDIPDGKGGFLEKFWKSTNAPVFNEKGAVAYVIHTSEDVTVQVRAENRETQIKGIERAYDLFMQAPVAVCIVSGKDHIVDLANQGMLQLLGRTKEMIGKPLAQTLTEAKEQGLLGILEGVYATGQSHHAPSFAAELLIDGQRERRYLDLVFQPYYQNPDDQKPTSIFCIAYNITKQIHAHQQLQESQQELQLAIDAADIGTFRLDLLTNQATSSQKVNEWFGYTVQGYSREEAFNRIHEEDRSRVDGVILKTLTSEDNSRHDVSYRVVHPKSGDLLHLRSFGMTLFNDQGKPYLIIGIIQNITQQILQQQQLEESEATLQKRVTERTADLQQQKRFIESILEASFNGIYALKAVRNPDGVIIDFRYLFANNIIAKQLEREVEAIIGASMLELIPENRDNGFFDLFCRVLQTGESYQDETHFVAQNIDRWFNYVMVPIDEETVVTSIEDITERKRTAFQMEEQRNLLESILKNSSNGISVTEMIRDEAGNVVDAMTIMANDAAVKYIGLPKEVFLSKTAIELDPNILHSPYGLTCLKTLETGEPSLSQYYMEITGRWQELTISKMDDNHLIHIFTDVTSIKEVQLQLERSVEELKRSNQSLEEFAYAASHDMKEPIRKIHFFADRLKERLKGKLEGEDQRYFERLEAGTKRMTSLIDDLLVYSHVNRGVSSIDTVNLNHVLSCVLDDLELHIEQKRATLKVGSLPIIVGRPRQLQQLFENLIGNALKYSKEGVAPEIHLTAHVVKGSDSGAPAAAIKGDRMYHCIKVQDNGIGFEQADADRIFTVFTRLHGNAEGYRGSGIGLSIAQKVVQNHGGYIWAESSPGEGATFKILLPLE